jgi:ribosomal protein S19
MQNSLPGTQLIYLPAVFEHALFNGLNTWRKCNMRKGKIAAYRRKSMIFGGVVGAAFGVFIGSVVGMSFEAALTGFFGGLILGEMITYGRNFPTHHHAGHPKK